MQIDLTCPAEVFRTALPTEEIPGATLTLYNLSDRVIVSVEVLLRLLDEDGEEEERLTFRGRALNGRPHSTFLLTAPCAPAGWLKSIEAQIQKVWYADNETWRRDPANATEYTPNNLPVCPALTNLKYAAGETAVGYPSLQRGLWVCVCGRPNPEGAAYCARCGQSMETVFSRFTPDAVEAQISMKERQLDLSSRNMREDTIRLQRLREEEYQAKKARRASRIRIFLGMAFSVALALGILFYGAPWLRLTAGRRAMEAGDLASARNAFTALGSFANAEELAAECDWRMAMDAAENSTSADTLAQASALLRAVSDRPEALEKANEADLLRARLLVGQGKWKEALEAMALLPEEYEGRKDLEAQCRMAEASGLFAAGNYDEARPIFLELGEYAGAREKASLCLYEPAMALMESGDWDGAIEKLGPILDFQDSRSKSQECHYHKAETAFFAGEYTQAADEFLLAGEWADAPERYKSLIYGQAEDKFLASDLKAAQSLFASIPDYLDANEKEMECRYFLAQDAAGDREFTLALELLEGIPDDYLDTRTLRAEACYEKAKAAFAREDWETAWNLLKDLDRASLQKQYRDIENLYVMSCEKLGKEAYPATPEPAPATPVPEPTPVPDVIDPFLVTEEEKP